MRVGSTSRGGFSLIELMVGIAVLGILVLLAMPSYRQWILNSRVRSVSESIQNGLRIARSQAVELDTSVRFELSSANSANWEICVPATAASACAGITSPCSATVRTSCLIQKYVSQAGNYGILIGSVAGAGASFGTTITGLGTTGVTFTPLGRPSDFGNTSLGRVDVYSTTTGSRRLVNVVSAGGSVRECDPNLPLTTSTPEGCS